MHVCLVQSESFDIDTSSDGYEPTYFELLFVQDIEILLLEMKYYNPIFEFFHEIEFF